MMIFIANSISCTVRMSKATVTQSLHNVSRKSPSRRRDRRDPIYDDSILGKVVSLPLGRYSPPVNGEGGDVTDSFDLMNGKLHVYKRKGSALWQCAAYLAGKNRRRSTGQRERDKAAWVAEEWYIGLRGKVANGEEVHSGKKFSFVAEKFIDEFEVITAGERNATYVSNHRARIRNHLNPYFGEKFVTEITSGMVQEYRAHRIKTNASLRTGEPKPLARSTLHQEIVCLRQILTVAEAHNWIKAVPTVTPRYKASGKVSHRAWFSPEEYKRLRDETRRRAAEPSRPRFRDNWEALHDYVLFMVNTGLRPDEAGRLQLKCLLY